MYNVEEYISDSLNSVLNQTFKNFEVIVVDDCSTDNSVVIVESFIPKFGGRLKLMKLKTNNGNPAVPRNFGLAMSRGKYIFFMDSDDAITSTALEEMYNLAENFQADVIYCLNYGFSEGIGDKFFQSVSITDRKFVDSITFLPYDLTLRLKYYLNFVFEAPPWLKFSLRDFLIENDIKFPLNSQEDNLWTLKLLCLAEKFLITPKPCYLHRRRSNSDSSPKKTFDLQVKYSMDRTIRGIKHLNNFMNSLDFFKNHTEFQYALFNFYAMIDFQKVAHVSQNITPQNIYETLKNQFGKILGEYDSLVAYLVTNNILLIKNLMAAQQKIDLLEKK